MIASKQTLVDYITDDNTISFSGGLRDCVVVFDDIDININKDTSGYTCELNLKGVSDDSPDIDYGTTAISIKHDIVSSSSSVSFTGVLLYEVEYNIDYVVPDTMFVRISFRCASVDI